MSLLRTLAAALLFTAAAGQAAAHTAFMKPANFTPSGDHIAAQAAFSTQIFCPAVGFAPETLQLLGPSGESREFESVTVRTFETMLDVPLSDAGTYRLSTGEVLGAATNMVYSRGDWRPVRPNERLSRRARTATMQMVTVAEAYVTKGEPTQAPLEAVIGTLAIRPITHPNRVTAASGFDAELLFSGAPFPNMPFVLYEPGQSEDDMERTFVTGADGRAHLAFEHPGVYVAVVRYRADAPEGAGVDVRSYSTSITFEVLP